MTPEEKLEYLQKKHDRFVEFTLKMRGWQRQWEMFHASLDKPKKQYSERVVDDLLREEMKEKRSRQKQLS